MKPSIILALAAAAGAASAEPPQDAARALIGDYVRAFNSGDAERIAGEIYAAGAPGVRERIAAEIDALRREDFGRIDLYSVSACPAAGDGRVRAEMRFAHVYTFGGLMPPGDQLRFLELVPEEGGLKIFSERAAPFSETLAC